MRGYAGPGHFTFFFRKRRWELIHKYCIYSGLFSLIVLNISSEKKFWDLHSILKGTPSNSLNSYEYLEDSSSAQSSCEKRLMFIIATGGINNQILAVINALLLANYLNMTAVVPTLAKVRTTRPLTFDPVPFTTYFDEQIYIAKTSELGVDVIPSTHIDERNAIEISSSSGKSLHQILESIQGSLDANKCQNVRVFNQWGIRWPASTPPIHDFLDVFEYRKELRTIAKSYQEKFLNFPHVAVHARVEETAPNVYFSRDFDKGRKDEVAGILQHLKQNSLGLPVYVASGVDCKSEIFRPIREAGFQLYCMNSSHAAFNDSNKESYIKSCVDSMISLNSQHFVGRYASSASFVIKLKRSLQNRTTSMYCSKSGFMCSDCGSDCLSHRGVRRHYKSVRDMENCFFLPRCGLSRSMCIDRSFSDGSYECPEEKVHFKRQGGQCDKIKNVVNAQDGYKFWFQNCKRGRVRPSCSGLLDLKCA